MERLHRAAVQILETTGLNVHHPVMRQQLAAAGARLGEEPRVFLPGALIDCALRSARREVVIYNRLGQPALFLSPHRVYFGTGSDLVFLHHPLTGERRKSTLADVARAARLCDALPEIGFVMSAALPDEVPNENREPQQYASIVANTIKPPIMTNFSRLGTLERMHAMACLVAGDDRLFRSHPNYVLYGQFVSPLQHDPLAVDRLVFCADHEVPLIYIPTIIAGTSGPITVAGALALAVAETLAGLVMHQVRHAGAPFIFGACLSRMDMRTMIFPYGSPEWRLSDLVMAELARHYGLPVFGTGGATDSQVVDAQAGLEYANSLLIGALAGINLIHDVGYLNSGLAGSLEAIVLGAEQIRWVRRFLAGIAVSEEDLALEVIDAVGPGRDFLGEQHTLRNLRKDMWLPYALNHTTYEAWVQSGARDYAERAADVARQLLRMHEPVPLAPSLAADLRELSRLSEWPAL